MNNTGGASQTFGGQLTLWKYVQGKAVVLAGFYNNHHQVIMCDTTSFTNLELCAFLCARADKGAASDSDDFYTVCSYLKSFSDCWPHSDIPVKCPKVICRICSLDAKLIFLNNSGLGFHPAPSRR